jgi:hypothetical protein
MSCIFRKIILNMLLRLLKQLEVSYHLMSLNANITHPMILLIKMILLFHGINDFRISEDNSPQGKISHVKLSELLRVSDKV